MKNDLTRRNVLGGAAALASSALLPGCGKSEAKPTPSPSAAPAAIGNASKPETPDMRFGIIALTDCSPIVIAHEKGFFKKYGINATDHQGRELGRHSRLALERRHPGDAHAARHADRVDHGSARLAQEADDHSLAAEPQRSGDHDEEVARRAR